MERRQFFGRSLGLAATAKTALVLGTAGAASVAQAARPATSGAAELVIEAVQMPAWSTHNGQRVPLSPGDTVSTAHEIETAPNAGLVMVLPEGSLIRLGEKTRLGVQQLEVSPVNGRTAVKSELKLFDGFFRFATSTVARAVGQREINLNLRTATVGIRGTDFWSMTDEAHDATCLFEGKVDLATRDQGALSLDKPTAFWARFFDKPVQPVGNATPDQLNKFLASTELQPGRGIAVQGGRWRVVAAAAPRKPQAEALATRLRAEGYPATVRSKARLGRTVHEVRIDFMATADDAAAVLAKISGIDGVQGRVALSA
jgi:hypothetical protein